MSHHLVNIKKRLIASRLEAQIGDLRNQIVEFDRNSMIYFHTTLNSTEFHYYYEYEQLYR